MVVQSWESATSQEYSPRRRMCITWPPESTQDVSGACSLWTLQICAGPVRLGPIEKPALAGRGCAPRPKHQERSSDLSLLTQLAHDCTQTPRRRSLGASERISKGQQLNRRLP
eukprot:scaffold1034_cov418-Prasinococcus_capsulatus_cf.AAC.19